MSLTGIQAYASSKAAQIGFTRQMAHELGPAGITVNCIAPGSCCPTPRPSGSGSPTARPASRRCSSGSRPRRIGAAEDIARGVLFFVSPAAGWVSGQTLSIDGGHSLF